MRQVIRWGVVLATLGGLFMLSQAGMLASFDRYLGDWRLEANSRPVSGNTVVVEIDSKSLAEIGVWPWPRSLYARLLDKLMAANVDSVAFDIDFSSASTPFEDAQFTASLEQAGGYAMLAAFSQIAPDGSMVFTRPLPEFAAVADPVLVNVLLDPITDRTRSFPIAAADQQGSIPSLATELGRPTKILPDVMQIDFSLDLTHIPRISFADLLYGRVDAAQLAGKQVIVGSSAIELRDIFQAPRFGLVAGPVLQALATETVRSGRILVPLGGLPGTVIVGFLGLCMLLSGKQRNLALIAGGLASIGAVGEIAALVTYGWAGIMVNTASLHVGLLLLLGLALADNGYHHLLGRRAAMERLHYLATHDPLTNTLSRQGLLDQPITDAPLVVVLLQLQTTDELRAMLGHAVVEGLFLRFSQRLAHAGFDELAFIGAASFALVRRDDGDADATAQTARMLVSTMSGTYQVGEHNLHVDVLAGYAAGSTLRSELLSQAEIALIQARTSRRATRGFSPADQTAMARHRRLDRDLRQALTLNQIRLIFQPQVDLQTRAIVGAETLMRWEHPELGLVSPVEFIPLAEETGLIVELGRWILEESMRQAAQWPSPITLAVNVSPIQFQHDDIVAAVRTALQTSGLPPHRLELEITESSRVTDPKRVHDVMWSLRRLGVRLSIDDFGTGYSSLSYFRDLPFDTVKIDQSFVRDRTSPEDQALLAAIVELAHKMDKHTVAEGIEDEVSAGLLQRLGCTYGQGYHFSRPVPGEQLCALLLGPALEQA